MKILHYAISGNEELLRDASKTQRSSSHVHGATYVVTFPSKCRWSIIIYHMFIPAKKLRESFIFFCDLLLRDVGGWKKIRSWRDKLNDPNFRYLHLLLQSVRPAAWRAARPRLKITRPKHIVLKCKNLVKKAPFIQGNS